MRTRQRTLSTVASATIVLLLALGGCGDGDETTTEADTLPSDAELDAAVEEVLSDCLLPDETVAEAVGEEIDFSTSLSGGLSAELVGIDDASGDLAVNWSGCAYTAVAGGEYTIAEHVDEQGNPDPSGFETVAAQEGQDPSSDVIQPDAAEPLPDIGDEAVVFADAIHFKVGDHAYVVSGQTKDYEPVEVSVIEPLAEVAAESLP